MGHSRNLLIAGLLAVTATATVAQEHVATLRQSEPLDTNAQTTGMPEVVNSDIRQVRNYPEQPPLIPHQIDNYQIDLNANKCLTCHSRTAIEVSQAPMVSVTHFMSRDGQVLAAVTPRRYFCTQCHVVQHDARPLVENGFVDVDAVLGIAQQLQEETD
ncbi:nitrate reductase cytochrome c-type subunit [Sulfitobacter sp. D35]|uniref:nitrate reductase cytochrome c-type subunit n=1 Tax=Sulfitobacter sp. D35 TaxID=3083252 RepID=UPI00296FA852|nr:nitrate reductase cytochrome c-type subunit [Sulfitobacter sp. D35]MDW4498493.1 nitrate reductase cytochrome c-type subunit [Sulfitobacter sp. D35]